ncbi:MAG: peptidyl-prolyl cis-trans isomerase, partial [Candidatus Delongbacteria bacterium]|nr:peptidyl-prolyl cis-trans isomerase [Candidatus Delongbacteria bacterium]
PITNFSATDRKKVLASFKDVVLDIDTLLAVLGTVQVKKRPPLMKLDHVIDILKNIFKVEMLEEYADQLGYTKNSELIDKAKETLIPIYRKTLIKKLIKSKIEVTDTEIKEFYEKNKERYKNPEGYDPLEKAKIGISNSIKAKKLSKGVKKWEEELYKEYKVNVNKVLLEESFYYISDDKK